MRSAPRLRAALMILCLSIVSPGSLATAQAAREAESAAAAGIVIVNLERIRSQSQAALSIESQAEDIRAALQTTFEARQRALAAEEQALLALRNTLDGDAFEARAARFEQQVRLLKKERRERSNALRQALRRAAEGLDLALQPILAGIMSELGATIMIDNRYVVISAKALDVTQTAINRLDEALPSLEVQWPEKVQEE